MSDERVGRGGGGSLAGIPVDYDKLDISILDCAPVPLRLCVTAHSCEGSLFGLGRRETNPKALVPYCFCGVFFFHFFLQYHRLQKFAKPGARM